MTFSPSPTAALAVILFAVLPLIACGDSSTQVQGPPGSDDDDDGGPNVQLADLTVALTVDAPDQQIAERLGEAAVLSGVDITLERLGGTEPPITATTDAMGIAHFSELLPGNYTASALRPLSASEAAQLGEEGDVTGFAGSATFQVQAPETQRTITVVAGRRGSIVFSEIFNATPRTPAGEYYHSGHFIELYNNSDTTVYLDGLVIAQAIPWGRDYEDLPCTSLEQWRLDPDGIWSQFMYQFPGSGRSHPLVPGETALLATDAIDHRPFVPELPNLSTADFEFIGSNDVNNPRVPDMITLDREYDPVSGRGYRLSGLNVVLALVRPVVLSELTPDDLPVVSPRHYRIPGDLILDLVATGMTPGLEAAAFAPLCERIVHERFDRGHGRLLSSEDPSASVTRRTNREADGRFILQRTRTTSRDFTRAALSPGSVN